MIPGAASPAGEALGAAAGGVSPPAGVVVTLVLLLALGAKVALQSTTRHPRRDALRLLDVVIAPLLVVFVIVVLERFGDLG